MDAEERGKRAKSPKPANRNIAASLVQDPCIASSRSPALRHRAPMITPIAAPAAHTNATATLITSAMPSPQQPGAFCDESKQGAANAAPASSGSGTHRASAPRRRPRRRSVVARTRRRARPAGTRARSRDFTNPSSNRSKPPRISSITASLRSARAAMSGSSAWVIGRPTTRIEAPASSARARRDHALLVADRAVGRAHAGDDEEAVGPHLLGRGDFRRPSRRCRRRPPIVGQARSGASTCSCGSGRGRSSRGRASSRLVSIVTATTLVPRRRGGLGVLEHRPAAARHGR